MFWIVDMFFIRFSRFSIWALLFEKCLSTFELFLANDISKFKVQRFSCTASCACAAAVHIINIDAHNIVAREYNLDFDTLKLVYKTKR
jgi:hypothetical protein